MTKEMRDDCLPVSSEQQEEGKERIWHIRGKQGIIPNETREGAEFLGESQALLILAGPRHDALHGPTLRSEREGKFHMGNQKLNGLYFLHQDDSLRDQ